VADRPTVDDFSRFLDELQLELSRRITVADRLSNLAVVLELRSLQTFLLNGRSRRGL
jgi:hypothetical protein